MLDRRISSDHFVTYINASDPEMGRLWAQWIVEKLHGKGNVVMLGGQAGSSPNENRMNPALEIFKQYPGIHILDTVYSDWSPVKAKQVMQAVIAKYGHSINAVWSAHGLQVPARSRPSSRLASSRARSRCTPRRTSTARCRWRSSTRCRCSRSAIRRRSTQARISVALKVLAGTTAALRGDGEFADRRHPGRRDGVDQGRPADHRPGGAERRANMLITNDLGPNYSPSTAHIDYPH